MAGMMQKIMHSFSFQNAIPHWGFLGLVSLLCYIYAI